MKQSPALGLTTVPIPNHSCAWVNCTHPWHLVHTHYPPNSYPSVHHHSADELLIAISVAQGPSYPPITHPCVQAHTHYPRVWVGIGYRWVWVPIAGLWCEASLQVLQFFCISRAFKDNVRLTSDVKSAKVRRIRNITALMRLGFFFCPVAATLKWPNHVAC